MYQGKDDIFYVKMCVDHCRYLAELETNNNDNNKHDEMAYNYYEKGIKYANDECPRSDAMRFGLALIFLFNFMIY